ETSRILTFELELPAAQYQDDTAIHRFYTRLIDQLAATPGVESAAAVSRIPLTSDGRSVRFSVEGSVTAPIDQQPLGAALEVSPEYFRTLGISILRGRGFTAQDSRDAPAVAMINDRLAERFFAGEDPLGKRIAVANQWLTIVGIAQSIMPADLGNPPRSQIFLPSAKQPARHMGVIVRSGGDPLTLAPSVRNAVWSVDKALPIDNVQTAEAILRNEFRGGRAIAILLGVFGGIALVLAVVGIYGVISYSASQRTHEIGVRIALGASRRDVVGMVVGRGMLSVVIGIAIGLLGGIAMGRVVGGALVGISPTDPLTFYGATILLTLVALTASCVPAIRATRIDPIAALRHE
ncbi:MAG: ABC transporter permease, partial [Phycisphaerales bacterium]|nr:ABC transporter permease [Phycisphaerales bacterium]